MAGRVGPSSVIAWGPPLPQNEVAYPISISGREGGNQARATSKERAENIRMGWQFPHGLFM